MECRSWDDLAALYEAFAADPRQRWVYRGARPGGLETSLERSAREFGIPPAKLPQVELGLLRQFARHYYHYAQHLPEPENYLEWFAIMRHYGAPTRLVDVTYSFHIAIFFALESPLEVAPAQPLYEANLWAVELNALETQLKRAVAHAQPAAQQVWHTDQSIAKYATFNALFMDKHPAPFAALVSPFRRHERLTIQQGAFLCPSDIQRPFMDNLRAVLPPEPDQAYRQVNIRVTREARSEILARLNSMNMNSATLFPGLEGFAQSLRVRLASEGRLLYTPDIANPLEP